MARIKYWDEESQTWKYADKSLGSNIDLTEYAKKEDIPEKLPNPKALTFTGAVNATYDGSEAVEVEIPQGGGGSGGELKANRIYSFTADGETMKVFDDVPIKDGGVYAVAIRIPQSSATSTTPMVSALIGLSTESTYSGLRVMTCQGQQAYQYRNYFTLFTRKGNTLQMLSYYQTTTTSIEGFGDYSGDKIYIYSSTPDLPIIKNTTVEVYKIG